MLVYQRVYFPLIYPRVDGKQRGGVEAQKLKDRRSEDHSEASASKAVESVFRASLVARFIELDGDSIKKLWGYNMI
jgi:hypothetical protein